LAGATGNAAAGFTVGRREPMVTEAADADGRVAGIARAVFGVGANGAAAQSGVETLFRLVGDSPTGESGGSCLRLDGAAM
jgi:hypothetical protein